VIASLKAPASLVLGVLLVIAWPSQSIAAYCAEWAEPPHVEVGETISVSFRTYVPIASGGDRSTLEPRPIADYPFSVRAVAPDGSARSIDVDRSTESDLDWVGSLTPDQDGAWTLTISNFQASDPACYVDATLMVEEASGHRPPTVLAVVLASILGAAGALALVLARRRGRAEA